MMRKVLLFSVCFLSAVFAFAQEQLTKDNAATKPDTVYAGIYATSIHDIDFKEKEYTISFWLWLKYRNRAFNFPDNLEIPNAKSFSRSYTVIDTSKGRIYMQMKIQAVMKDSWKIGNFPFDRQRLRLSFENSQYDTSSLVFAADTIGDHYDKRFTLNGWIIDSFNLSAGKKEYNTGFGDESLAIPHTVYSSLKVKIAIDRDATGLFWKMFLGMYIAFLIAFVCFFIHEDMMDSRFSLTVGSIFAVIGNKYIVDSSLPESTTFTLVDTLHGITLFVIFLIMMATAFSLHYLKKERMASSRRFDMIAAAVIAVLYVAANIIFIWRAVKGG